MASKRFRLQFKFWLDVNKEDEHSLAETIDELKQGKQYSKGVRDGLRLIVDLWRGNLQVLLALFPWVEDTFYERFQAQQPQPDTALHEQLKRLERLLLEQGHTPVTLGGTPVTSDGFSVPHGTPKAMTVAPVPAPLFDDDNDVELVITKASSKGDTAQNFLNSVFGLQH